jgi:hypothetical protein
MAALANNLTIFEGRIDAAPDLVLVDDGEKYAITTSNLRDLFTADGGLALIVNAIEDKVQGYELDVTTVKGRAEIRALAHKVTRSKTYLDTIGKEMVAELKDLPRRIDANRKMMRDSLDALAERTRADLTAYEERTKAISNRLNSIDSMPVMYAPSTSAEIAAQIEILANMPLTAEAWEGLLDEALTITHRTIAALRQMYTAKLKAETDAAELTQLREQAAERERKDAETKRIAEAQERGRREAEQRAESERQAALGREAEANRQATLAQQQAEESERRRVESEARAAQAAIDARLRAEAQAEQARVDAIKAEQDRVAEAARIAAEVQAARDNDKQHRKQINSEVLDNIEEALINAELLVGAEFDFNKAAKAITIAIIKGEVRHTTITY